MVIATKKQLIMKPVEIKTKGGDVMGAMKDQQIIVDELFSMSHDMVSLLGDLKIFPEEKRKELEEHAGSIGDALAPIVGDISVVDD